jgi:hypothetical protein
MSGAPGAGARACAEVMTRQARARAADLAGRESLCRSDDVDAQDLKRACSAMSSSDALRSVRRVPAPRRGCAAFDTGNSAAVAARAKRERGGQQLYVVAMACWRSEYLRGESVPLEHACCMRGCWSVR